MRRLAVAAGILALTALTWYEFPGHTWLQQDTQIYVPILEHLRNPAVLARDILVERPHVSFTLYDEVARALAWLTGGSFRVVLEAEQFVTRALGIWGLYLMATALGLSAPASLLVAGAISLGATIGGPAVLSFEIEPDPRGFAVPLLFLAVGLTAHGRDLAAGVAAAAAFLMHPPTVYPFWAVYACLALWRRRFVAFAPLAAACLALAIAARFQQGASEAQVFFSRLTPFLESLQRMRAGYSWISEWWREWLAHYLVLYAASVVAYVRIRRRTPPSLRFLLIGLPLIGILSVPASYLFLERLKWTLMPQIQPMRALLFVTVIAQFSAAVAGLIAAQARRYVEAFAWFALLYLVPLNANLNALPSWNRALAVALLAGAACVAAWSESRKFRCSPALLAGAAAAAFFLIPTLGGVRMYPRLHTPELAQLSAWARASTPPDSVFLFADAGKQLQPGIFRAEALRAVYVDWKGGGQINYLSELGRQWWNRWHQVMSKPFDPRELPYYRGLGIDYVVLSPQNRLAGRSAAFENGQYLVYAL
ncbi:MAG TPA: DUF6798 domain-containing protein [Bryobacteraceae bacterium]|nr:DUF6798 domain-containing protein [Bryobacteraceae bacterium]